MRGVPKLILSKADPTATQWRPKAYPSRLRHPISTQRTSSSEWRELHHHSGCNTTYIVIPFFAFRFIDSIQSVAFVLKTTTGKEE